MRAAHLAPAAMFVICGCNLFGRDLIFSGVYRLETAGVVGCEVAATAVDRDGKLHIDGVIRGMRLTKPVEGDVEIRLMMPDGKQKSEGRVALRLVSHRQTSHSHPRFETVLGERPPAGTAILVIPNFPLCPAVRPTDVKDDAGGQGRSQTEHQRR